MNSKIPSYGMIKSTKYDPQDQGKEVVFYEEGNPRCVVNLLPRSLRAKAIAIPPQFHVMPVHELEKSAGISSMDQNLRLAFWDEFSIACDNKKTMRMESVYGRLTTREYFHVMIADNPAKFAYVLRPPQDYMLRMRSLLEVGMRRFEEILQLPLIKEQVKTAKGRDNQTYEIKVKSVDTKLIGEIVKIVSLIDNRVKGAVVQKLQVEQKNLNVNMDYEAPKTYEEITKELKGIEKEIREIQGTSGTAVLDGDNFGSEDIIEVEEEGAGVSES